MYVYLYINRISRMLHPLDFERGRCLVDGATECSAEFAVVWIRNARDVINRNILPLLPLPPTHALIIISVHVA